MAFIFQTFYGKDGKKYAKFGNTIIPMDDEPTKETQPMTSSLEEIKGLCNKYFKKYKIQYNERCGKPTFILSVGKDANTKDFEKSINLLFDKIYYDIVRI